MTYGSAANAYRRTEITTSSDPRQLILLLYNGAIRFLETAKCGIQQGDLRKRGESLGRAIAIITELNASLDVEKGGETAEFLRGLYLHMLVELPKVNLDNNIEKIDHVIRYLKELKRLWEERVMGRGAASGAVNNAVPAMENRPAKAFSVAI